MALFRYNSDPKYSVNEINIKGKQVGAVILFRLRYVYTLIYFVGASYFIIFVFIYLFCCLSVVVQELSTPPESPLSCCSILSFLSNVLYICSWVRFSFGYCIVCPSIYTIWLPLWYLQTFLIICCFFSFKLVCLLLVQFGAPICEPHQRTKMPRSKIKQDFHFTTLKGFKIIKLTTCDRLYNTKFVHLLRCLTLFLIPFYRLNTCLLWENIECSPLLVPIVNKTNYLPLTNVK